MVFQLIKKVLFFIKISVHLNQFSNVHVPEGTNRESYRQAIEASIKFQAEQDRNLKMPNLNRRFFK